MDASRLRAGFLLLLTFAAGAALGVAGDRLDLVPGVAEAGEPTEGRDGREERRERQTTIERFADDLGLTSQQRSEIEAILDQYRASAKALRAEVQPRYASLMDSIRSRIESVLTGEQVEQYRDLLEERARREGWGRLDGDTDGPRSDEKKREN